MRDDEAGDRAAAERARAEARTWREIVDHYGEQPDVEGLVDLTAPLEGAEPPDGAAPLDPPELAPTEPFRLELYDESFTPPPLPPPPTISPGRRLAWVGLVASPLLLVLVNLMDYSLPGILSVGLVVIFIASFGYLIATMTPRDPDDDGARL
jgi:hypothetical protein